MANEWYYSKNGSQHGPVAGAGLKALAGAGKLLPIDLVWKEGMAEWLPASKVVGLFPPVKEVQDKVQGELAKARPKRFVKEIIVGLIVTVLGGVLTAIIIARLDLDVKAPPSGDSGVPRPEYRGRSSDDTPGDQGGPLHPKSSPTRLATDSIVKTKDGSKIDWEAAERESDASERRSLGLEDAVLELQVLRVKQSTRGTAEYLVQVTNRSKRHIELWKIKADCFDVQGKFLANGSAIGSELAPGKSQTETFDFPDVGHGVVNSWRPYMGSVWIDKGGGDSLTATKYFTLREIKGQSAPVPPESK